MARSVSRWAECRAQALRVRSRPIIRVLHAKGPRLRAWSPMESAHQLGKLAGAWGHRCSRRTSHLAHLRAAAAQERVGLVDKQQQPAPAALRPVEQLMELLHGLAAQGRHVAAAHDCIVQARRARQPLCRH